MFLTYTTQNQFKRRVQRHDEEIFFFIIHNANDFSWSFSYVIKHKLGVKQHSIVYPLFFPFQENFFQK